VLVTHSSISERPLRIFLCLPSSKSVSPRTAATDTLRVFAYPLGKGMAWFLPIREFHMPKWLGGFSFSFNPGPFNIKEHTIIVMMANVSIGPAYALYVTVSSTLYYNRDLGIM
jgi:hypothetical protein